MSKTARSRSRSRSLRFAVLERDAFTCSYCGRSAPDVQLEVDHVVPISKGGPDDIRNLVAACVECNRGKAAKRIIDNRDAVSQVVLMRRELKEARGRAISKGKEMARLVDDLTECRRIIECLMRELGAEPLYDPFGFHDLILRYSPNHFTLPKHLRERIDRGARPQ